MDENKARGLLIPVGEKPREVLIDKNDSLSELQGYVGGNVDVLGVLGDGIDLWVNDEGLFNGSMPNRAIYANKSMERDGYLDQLTFSHPVQEGELYTIICGDFLALSCDEEGAIASLPQETIDNLKETFEDPMTGYSEWMRIKNGGERNRNPSVRERIQNSHEVPNPPCSLADEAKDMRDASEALRRNSSGHGSDDDDHSGRHDGREIGPELGR